VGVLQLDAKFVFYLQQHKLGHIIFCQN